MACLATWSITFTNNIAWEDQLYTMDINNPQDPQDLQIITGDDVGSRRRQV